MESSLDFHYIDYGIDLSELGYAEGESAESLLFQAVDARNSQTNATKLNQRNSS
jgi:hypothetical protein